MIPVFVMLILAALAVYFACRFFLLRSSVRMVRRELEEISGALGENRVVKLSVPEREMEMLLENINQNLKEIRAQRQEYRNKEQQLKQQVENISHDLRTPLTAVLGYLKMIDKKQLAGDEREYLEIAVKKSLTMQTLVTQFYELSRVTSGDFQPKREKLDGARILRECCLENYLLFEKEEKDLQIALPEKPLMVYADSEALERIFMNLLQNGIRYAKSRLEISAEAVSCTDGKSGAAMVSFTFKNDIAPELEAAGPEQLFDRFYMQEQSRSRGGSGLGLTITRHLVQHMGGTAEAKYVTESGTRCLVLQVKLPAA